LKIIADCPTQGATKIYPFLASDDDPAQHPVRAKCIIYVSLDLLSGIPQKRISLHFLPDGMSTDEVGMLIEALAAAKRTDVRPALIDWCKEYNALLKFYSLGEL
jgi:hypothetical protein